jgi:hypothetical protein
MCALRGCSFASASPSVSTPGAELGYGRFFGGRVPGSATRRISGELAWDEGGSSLRALIASQSTTRSHDRPSFRAVLHCATALMPYRPVSAGVWAWGSDLIRSGRPAISNRVSMAARSSGAEPRASRCACVCWAASPSRLALACRAAWSHSVASLPRLCVAGACRQGLIRQRRDPAGIWRPRRRVRRGWPAEPRSTHPDGRTRPPG